MDNDLRYKSSKEQHHKELNLGERKVSHMNFSNIVTLPKIFTKNFLGKSRMVSVTLLEDGTLKIRPITKENENDPRGQKV